MSYDSIFCHQIARVVDATGEDTTTVLVEGSRVILKVQDSSLLAQGGDGAPGIDDTARGVYTRDQAIQLRTALTAAIRGLS